MKSVLRSLPVLALAVAAIESVWVRLTLPWRGTDPLLFAQAFGLWLALGLVVAVPAAWTAKRLTKPRRGAEIERLMARKPPTLVPALSLFGWMVLPIAMHATLDRYTRIGGNVSGLIGSRPWLEAAGVALVGMLVLGAVQRLLGRVSSGRLALAVTVLALVTGVFLPRRAPAAGAAPASAGLPNLLLLVWDTCRADRLTPYRYERDTTPHLARLADESLLFEESRSAAIFTFTSHLSLLTGAYPSTHGARLLWTRYDPERAESIAEILRQAGYRTGGFVGTDVLAGRTGIRHGFEVYDDRVDPPVCDTFAWAAIHDLQALLAHYVPALRHNGQPHWIQDFQRPAEGVLDSALAWIRSDDPRPWFCFVNLYDVHWPYVPVGPGRELLVRPYDGPMDGYLFRSDRWTKGYVPDEADKRHLGDLYDAELHDLDRAVDAFVRELDLAAGDTGVVMTSDHGEAFGEANRWAHEDLLEPQVRIPLLVRFPGRAEEAAPADPNAPEAPGYAPSDGPPLAPRSGRSAFPTSGVDVAPTLLAMAGLPASPAMEGLDLGIDRSGEGRHVVVEDRDHVQWGDVRVALYQGPWKLVRHGLGAQRGYALYDLAADPLGVVDVSDAHPVLAEELRGILEELRAEADEREAGAPSLDAGEAGDADALRALGYAGD